MIEWFTNKDLNIWLQNSDISDVETGQFIRILSSLKKSVFHHNGSNKFVWSDEPKDKMEEDVLVIVEYLSDLYNKFVQDKFKTLEEVQHSETSIQSDPSCCHCNGVQDTQWHVSTVVSAK